LQSFLEKNNFIGKSTIAKENVRLRTIIVGKKNVKIEKNYAHKKSLKIKKITLSSLEYSISKKEDFNSHMPFPIFATPFQKHLSSYAFL
jgi:hypothetical protein